MDFVDMVYNDSTFFNGMLAFAVVSFLIMVVVMAVPLAIYAFESAGLYAIACRRCLQYKWLAWVPLGRVWLLGSISDQYQYLVKGKIRYRRRWLLLLITIIMALCAGCAGVMSDSVVLSDYMAAVVAQMMGEWLVLGGLIVAFRVLRAIAYFDLFRSCQPGNAVLYLVMSILLPVLLPLLVFFVRNKDLGMPPRKEPISDFLERLIQSWEENPGEEEEESSTEDPTE